ncbi:MAG: DUF6044 family protein [candidate division WOR-3 bacterium]
MENQETSQPEQNWGLCLGANGQRLEVESPSKSAAKEAGVLTLAGLKLTRTQLIIGFATLVLVLYLLPMVVLWDDSHIRIHDNLDSTVPSLTFLNRYLASPDSGSGLIEPFLRLGTPRIGYTRFLSVIGVLWVVLEPFAAYLVNDILVHIVAFVGMLLLLRRLFREQINSWVNEALLAGVALCWAILPHHTAYGVSIAGQPLLFAAFFNFLRCRARIWDYAIVLFFPLYSSLATAGVFIVAVLALIFVVDWVCNRRANRRFFVAVALLLAWYFVLNHRLIYEFFAGSGYVSHRTEFAQTSLTFSGALGLARENLVEGQDHAVSLHKYIFLLAVPIALFAGFRRNRSLKWILVLLGATAAISAFRGLLQWNAMSFLPRVFQFDRFYFLQPTIWYIIFALCLLMVASLDLGYFGSGKYYAVALLVFQFQFVANSNRLRLNDVDSIVRKVMGRPPAGEMTYRGFFSEELFRDIAEFIGRPQSSYRVVSLGIFPAVAQYNGFYTLDGYRTSYPLWYKRAFRKIIEWELEKSPKWKEYFDTWGSRCYIFSSELDELMYTKQRRARVYNLELNTAALRALGGEYIISAVDIVNDWTNDLSLLGVFENDDSPWRIFLYRVRDEPVSAQRR